MNKLDIYQKLCYYDERNPNCSNDPMYPEDHREPRTDGCACDNCFYGKDEFALKVLDLHESEEHKTLMIGCLAELITEYMSDAEPWEKWADEQAEAMGQAIARLKKINDKFKPTETP